MESEEAVFGGLGGCAVIPEIASALLSMFAGEAGYKPTELVRMRSSSWPVCWRGALSKEVDGAWSGFGVADMGVRIEFKVGIGDRGVDIAVSRKTRRTNERVKKDH